MSTSLFIVGFICVAIFWAVICLRDHPQEVEPFESWRERETKLKRAVIAAAKRHAEEVTMDTLHGLRKALTEYEQF